MYPEILRIGDFVISSYGLMLVIAFLTGNFLLRKDMISLGKDTFPMARHRKRVLLVYFR